METQAPTTAPKRKRGRPKGTGKINHDIIARICHGIENGLTYNGACSYAGIDPTTFYAWRKKAEDAQSGIYADFSKSLAAAELTARNKIEHALMKSALGYTATKKRQVLDKEGNVVTLTDEWTEIDTTTLRFIAERRWPKDWGRKDKLDLTSGDQPLEIGVFGAVTMGSHGAVEETEE